MKRLMIGLIVVLGACAPKVEPIRYGQDQCAYCKMTITDNHFAAQLVTLKGRNYKFDAAECLIWFLEEGRVDSGSIYKALVSDYAHPGTLIDAYKAIYLVSPQIHSPMGANLAAFADRATAAQFQKRYGGELYTWREVRPVVVRRKERLQMHHH